MDNTMQTETIIQYVRITQILKDEGWTFIDNGYNKIIKAINERNYAKVEFQFLTNDDFLYWLFEKGREKI